MHYRLRGLLYLGFLAVFLVTAPAVVLYTAGFRLSFEGGGLVKTGLLSVSTIPKGVTVSVDGTAHRQTTPVLLDNLLPGKHAIALTKDGYFPWKKTLPIDENETTFVPKAVLFLQSAAVLDTPGTFVAQAVDQASKRVAYGLAQKETTEIWTRRIGKTDDVLLARYPNDEFSAIHLTWSAQGGMLLIEEVLTDGSSSWTIVSADGRTTLDMDAILKQKIASKEEIADVYMDPVNDARAYALTDERVFTVSIPQGQASVLLNEPSIAIQTDDGIIAVRTKDEQMTAVRIRSGSEQALAQFPSGSFRFLPAPNSFLLLLDADAQRLLLLDASGADRPILLSATAKQAAWGTENAHQLLYTSDFEIHVFDTQAQTDELVTRVSDPIVSTSWYPSGTAVLYANATSLFASELDERDGRNVDTLANPDALSAFWLDDAGKTAFFIGGSGDEKGLFSLSLEK